MDLEINFFPKFIYIISTSTIWYLGILITARKPAEGALGNALLTLIHLKEISYFS